VTKISGYRCDGCGLVGNFDQLVGWVALAYMADHDPHHSHADYMGERKHACSRGCAHDILDREDK
jgi:hypothetical protein